MWPTEYLLHEHRKDLLREAAQNELAREAQMPRRRLLAAVSRLLNFRRPRPVQTIERAARPQTVILGRVN